MKKHNIVLVVISIVTLLFLVSFAAYSFFSVGNLNLTRAANINAISEQNNMVFDTIGGELSLSIDAGDMTEYLSGNVAAQNNTPLLVSFQSNVNFEMICTYDIVYEWLSTDKYQTHSQGVTEKEFTIQAALGTNSYATQGTNYIRNETDIADIIGSQTSATVVTGAQIRSTGNARNTAVWTLKTKFYNIDADQSTLSGKTYSGRFKVTNVSCVDNLPTLADYLINNAPKSGTDVVSTSSWKLTSDRTGEWRYAGANPNNYIRFNGELWRIIGVMPDMEYCTGEYGTATECETTSTGSLVKIMRNDSIGDFAWDSKRSGVGSSKTSEGSNDWSDSQLMLMLNGANYLKTAYDENGNKLHTSYTITNNIVADSNGYNYYNATYSYLDGNGTTIYTPSVATTSGYTAVSGDLPKKIGSDYVDKIATVKWYLYGTSTTSSDEEGSPLVWYKKERNIDNLGAVYTYASLTENRPAYWYGKIGLMYPSDYGYATNGSGLSTGDYTRTICLQHYLNSWRSGDYQIYCAKNSWLLYLNTTSSMPLLGSSTIWTMTSDSGGAYGVYLLIIDGMVPTTMADRQWKTRPVLYLKADTQFGGYGNGTWNNPYTIK